MSPTLSFSSFMTDDIIKSEQQAVEMMELVKAIDDKRLRELCVAGIYDVALQFLSVRQLKNLREVLKTMTEPAL